MRHSILLVAAGVLLASCGSTRKTTSSNVAKSDSTASVQTAAKSDSSGSTLLTDEKVKITTTKIDTNVTVPADSLEGTVSIKPGDSTIQTNIIESGGMKIQTSYDPTTGQVKVKATSKPREVPVQAETTTMEREASTSSKTAAVSSSAEQKTEVATSSEERSKASEVVRKPGLLSALWPWWLIALIIGLLYVFWRYRPTLVNGLQTVRRWIRK